MASDILVCMKKNTEDSLKASLECSNQNLRQMLFQHVSDGWQTQGQFAQLCMQKGWYSPAASANAQEANQILQSFTQAQPNIQMKNEAQPGYSSSNTSYKQ